MVIVVRLLSSIQAHNRMNRLPQFKPIRAPGNETIWGAVSAVYLARLNAY